MKMTHPFYRLARKSALIFPLVMLVSTTIATAASVCLSWDPSDGAHEGYRVFARRSDQLFNYSQPDWEGSSTTCTIDDLENQTEYFFVVKAYDDTQESADSAELHYTTSDAALPGQDSTPPSWEGATFGVGLGAETSTGECVTVEFDTASDAVDGTNLKFNVYHAPSESWNDEDWSGNDMLMDAAVDAGATFTHAITICGLRRDVGYTFGVRVEDQSGNEDDNAIITTAMPSASRPARY